MCSGKERFGLGEWTRDFAFWFGHKGDTEIAFWRDRVIVKPVVDEVTGKILKLKVRDKETDEALATIFLY